MNRSVMSIHSRTMRGIALAFAVVALAVSGSATARAQAMQISGQTFATAKLKAKGVGTLKVPTGVGFYMNGSVRVGNWVAQDDDGALYLGWYAAADTKGNKFSVTFDPESLEVLAGVLENLVLDEAGISAQVVSITQRPATLSLSKKRTKAALKLVFDIVAYVDGVYRTATYTVPLKGTALVTHGTGLVVAH